MNYPATKQEPTNENEETQAETSLAATAETANSTLSSSSATDVKEPDSDTAFAPFRLYVNRRLRERSVVLKHDNETLRNVTELTPEGKLRLQVDEGAALVSFDDTNIAEVMKQIIL